MMPFAEFHERGGLRMGAAQGVAGMEITEVRIRIVDEPAERLRAFCSVTLGGEFVIRDIRIIDGANGPFVAMPSRKLTDRCGKCGCKNHFRARFCNDCGQRLNENRVPRAIDGRAKLYADIAHPINAECRERLQTAILEAYQNEVERMDDPDYVPAHVDPDDAYGADEDRHASELRAGGDGGFLSEVARGASGGNGSHRRAVPASADQGRPKQRIVRHEGMGREAGRAGADDGFAAGLF